MPLGPTAAGLVAARLAQRLHPAMPVLRKGRAGMAAWQQGWPTDPAPHVCNPALRQRSMRRGPGAPTCRGCSRRSASGPWGRRERGCRFLQTTACGRRCPCGLGCRGTGLRCRLPRQRRCARRLDWKSSCSGLRCRGRPLLSWGQPLPHPQGGTTQQQGTRRQCQRRQRKGGRCMALALRTAIPAEAAAVAHGSSSREEGPAGAGARMGRQRRRWPLWPPQPQARRMRLVPHLPEWRWAAAAAAVVPVAQAAAMPTSATVLQTCRRLRMQ